jgi:hypothetical protein
MQVQRSIRNSLQHSMVSRGVQYFNHNAEIGQGSLPFDIPVEIETIWEFKHID